MIGLNFQRMTNELEYPESISTIDFEDVETVEVDVDDTTRDMLLQVWVVTEIFLFLF